MESLPDNLLVQILRNFDDPKTLVSFSKTCRRHHKIVKEEIIWRQVDLAKIFYSISHHKTNLIDFLNSNYLPIEHIGHLTLPGWIGKSLAVLKQTCPNLRSLAIHGYNRGTAFSLNDVPKTVERLYTFCHLPRNFFEPLSNHETCLPNLKHLNQHVFGASTPEAKTAFLNRVPKLESLQLGFIYSSECIEQLSNSLHNVVSLTIEFSSLEDEFLMALSQNCRYLRILEFSNCSNLTDFGVEYLTRNECLKSDLKKLSLNNCTKITDQSLRCLASLQSLDFLNLRGTKLSIESLDEFWAKKPHCRVF